jgi:two-component system, NtrC family, nitrogen regulation sensor histidine kinase NtrY
LKSLVSIKERRVLITLALTAAWLYTFSLLYQLFFTNTDNPQKVVARIENYIWHNENDFDKQCTQTAGILRLFNRSFDLDQLKQLEKKDYGLFVYHETTDSVRILKFWSKNFGLPSDEQLALPDGRYELQRDNGQFEYLRKTLQVNDTRIVVTALLPVRWEYFISNDYLKKGFPASAQIEKRFTWSPVPSTLPVKNGDGKIIMYLKERKDERNTGYSLFVIITRTASVIFLLIICFYTARVLCRRKNFAAGFGFLLLSLLLLRLMSVLLPFPFNNSRLEFFDPGIYASGRLLASLGDLVINLLLLFLVILFISSYRRQAVAGLPPWLRRNSFALGVAALAIFVMATFATCWLIRSLVADSKISFNVTNFFNLNAYSVIGFIVVAMLVVVYYYAATALLKVAQNCIPLQVYRYGVIAFAGLLLLYLRLHIASDRISIFVLLWMLLLHAMMHYLAGRNGSRPVAGNIIWLVFFCASVCVLFNHENNKKEMLDRKVLAQNLANRSNPASENLLSIALSRFDNGFLYRNFPLLMSDSNGLAFKKNLINDNFIGYLNEYATRIFTYDSTEKGYNNPDSTSYQTFNALALNQGTPIRSVPDLYFRDQEQEFDKVTYIFNKRVEDTAGRTVGYFVVEAFPTSFKASGENMSPELFKQRNDYIIEKANDYVSAVYNKFELRRRFIDYDFPVQISAADIPIQEDTIRYRNGYEELWYKLSKDLVVVIGKKNNMVLTTITLFAYLFFSFLAVWLLVQFFEMLFAGNISRQWLRRLFQMSIRNQVQAIVLFASLLSFLVILIAIISLFTSRFEKNNRQRLSRTMSILLADVQNKVRDNSIFDDVVKVYDAGNNERLSEVVTKMAEIHNIDFSVYNLAGSLTVTSQPFVRSKGIVSDKIDPRAFYQLSTRQSAQYVQQEHIGAFSFLSMYVPIRDEKGQPYGYLNIPYYSSRSDLKQEISNFVVTIINLNAFIFLVAGLIAWLVTNRITSSFSLISTKMKEVNLGSNEVITWHRNDEIGGLVNEYNKMVKKLEESAVVLAKSERESAWREMARQVAHEIKNPLTPMKLSIQYLQKSIAGGTGNVQDLTASVTRTLVEQIDHLSNIASDFSQFANIIHSKNERVHLYSLLQSLQSLFSSEEGVTINLENTAAGAEVISDKTHINRLFTNLIQNALQAYEAEGPRRVDINVQQLNGFVMVAIQDFGPGISEKLRHKIFTPNFTTKTSGTGLGLAISKGIAEQAGGDITFETEPGRGTTFFVTLPVGDTPGRTSEAETGET